MSNYFITVKRTDLEGSERRHEFYANVIVTDGKREALFILHGEPKINKYKFSQGKTTNGVKLWTRHDINFNSDLNFVKFGRWGKYQDKVTEFADMLTFMNECHDLQVLYTDKPGTITYKITDGKIHDIFTDEIKDLYEITLQSMWDYETTKNNGFPEFYVEKLKEKANKNYSKIKAGNHEAAFHEYVTREYKKLI